MKNNRNPLYSAVHYALAAGVASGFGASGVAFAQDEDVAELERVEVTGSRIKRTDIEGPNPVFVMQREDIEQTGLVTVGDILENLPIAGSGLNTNVNNGGDGSILLDLRNLGSNRLLVLVNGRRWTASPSVFVDGAVDLQTIPTAIIERVEVLKDGASAIYGSDAISGVVNIITRDDFTGAQANAYYGQWDEDDGETTQADFSIGSTGERGSVFMNASYVKQEPIFAGDRAISAEPFFGTGNNFGSSGTPEGRVFFVDPDTGGIRDLTFEGGATFPDGAPASAYRPFSSVDAYNFAPDNYLLTPSERYGIYTSGRYEISDNIAFFGEGLFNKRESSQLLAATPLFIGDFVGDSTYIAADQPFNPFDITLGTSGGGTPYFMGRRMLEAGNRVFNQDVHTYQFTGGLEGNFEAGGRFWDWETYYQFSRNDESDITVGLINLNRVQNALDPALCTGDCVPLNLWGGAGGDTVAEVARNGGTITDEMIDYIEFTAQDRFIFERNLYAANLTGTLFDLPAGPLGVAVGYEYRRDKGSDTPDSLIALGATSGNARQPTAGSFNVDEYYVEFSIPILSDVPGAEVLEASAAARWSDYSTFGSTTNTKFGLRWQPYSDLLVRGTFGEAFRAPAIGELFQGQSDSFPNVNDPCSDMLALAGSGQPGGRDNPQPQNIIDNCIADGVPANGSYRQINSQIRITVGGNPNVGPETAETTTFGLVFSPTFLDGLDVTVDYYDIELENTVTSLGPNTILNGCYDGENQNLCSLITRGAGGVVDDLLSVSTNIGGTETSGVDFGINYSFPETPFGFFEAQWDATYVDEYTNFIPNAEGELEPSSLVGFNAGDVAFPRWKSNMYLDWSYGDWGAVYTMRYIHHQDEVCPSSLLPFGLCSGPINSDNDDPAINHLESVVYHDAQLSYHYQPWDSRFTVGARNLFDKEPPLCFQCFANSYDPTTHDIPGRFWYVRVTTNF